MGFIRWQTAVDFLVLAMAFYVLLLWARSARALRIALGVVGLHALALLARQFDLVITSWLLDFLAILAVVLLLLVFQPELRRLFMGLDSALRRWAFARTTPLQHHREIASACFDLAKGYTGALLVIVRKDSVGELLEGGVSLEAEISSKLLRAIFQKDSPLHDGAVIIEHDRISRANTVLPLTHRPDVPLYYGTRHRAAMGLAERCDALVLAVSEERGEVSLMQGKSFYEIETPAALITALELSTGGPPEKPAARIRRILTTNPTLKLGALGLAFLIWSMSFLAAGTTIRSVSVPIEFRNLPAGMQVAQQSVDSMEIQLRGSPWIMDSVNLGNRIARFDLSNLGPGWHQLVLAPVTLELPPGLVVDHTTPTRIAVLLARASVARGK
ncbi:MAG: DNA integrity scanning protein DisA nucleotide-binding domain protein [Acidobacteriia bacterium]|nr:DNA integrity scanning protein DisA nucleotide-binding domain protein [Terriglobia bacterium]